MAKSRKNRTIVAAIIMSGDGKLLMGRKNPQRASVYSDCWHLPGGGIETGEDHFEALKREIAEETGLVITSQRMTLLDDSMKNYEAQKRDKSGKGKKVIMDFFVYQVDMNEVSDQIKLKTNGEFMKLKWFEKSQLTQVKLTPPSIQLFKNLVWI